MLTDLEGLDAGNGGTIHMFLNTHGYYDMYGMWYWYNFYQYANFITLFALTVHCHHLFTRINDNLLKLSRAKKLR